MSSGWIEGFQVSSVCKEQHASSPVKRSLLYCYFIYCYVLMFSYVSVHVNCGEGFVGLFQQQKHHWILPLFELWSVSLHLKNTTLYKGAYWCVQCN